ncbi:hypothetical protein B0J13DRAFT_646500 [Dactylonectria estremocensis]|uniref:Uncharacterized protein n=1 Tax=Dactylonectria estremocensis TaxID=1079267 RepID=A0A9P9DW14_9HYPO|nr:hypothetical protein B0J13DRAFT_646500 [Dactylonectria estremocensis]
MNEPTAFYQPLQRQKISRWPALLLSLVAAMLSFATSAILIFITFVENELTSYGTLSTIQKTAYTIASTAVATILTAFIISQITSTLLCQIDDALFPLLLSEEDNNRITHLASSWQAVIGVGSLTNKLKPQNWGTTSIMILAGLITTCITAGFTPTIATRSISHGFEIPSGDSTIFAAPYLPNEMPDSPAAYNHSSWWMRNGSIFYSWGGRGGSPAHDAMQLSHGINIIDPEVYAYVDEGVAVEASAVGTPYSVYASSLREDGMLATLLQIYDWNVVNLSACVPVMVRNPYKCRKGAHMEWTNDDTLFKLSSNDGKCVLEKTVSGVSDVEMIKGWCTHGEIGENTVLLGSNFNYHAWLAVAVNDPDIPPYDVPERYTYSVQCDVDTRNVFEYRKVVLKLAKSPTTGNAYARVLTAEGSCVPQHASTIGNVLTATAATANLYLLAENSGNSGWFETINKLTTRSGGYGLSAQDSKRSPPWAFNDSSNALEDIFGLTAALVSSRIVKNSRTILTEGNVTVSFTRIGPGRPFAVAFAIPPFLAGLLILVLLFLIQPFNSGFDSSSLLDLVNVGKGLRNNQRE